MAIVLTKRQRKVLQMMAAGEELVQDRSGKGWPQYWIGIRKTNYKLWWFLVENVLISTHDDFNSKTVYWHINEAGERLLKGEKKIYSIGIADGSLRWVEDWREGLRK